MTLCGHPASLHAYDCNQVQPGNNCCTTPHNPSIPNHLTTFNMNTPTTPSKVHQKLQAPIPGYTDVIMEVATVALPAMVLSVTAYAVMVTA
jgi:hypothetical protein